MRWLFISSVSFSPYPLRRFVRVLGFGQKESDNAIEMDMFGKEEVGDIP